MLNKTIAKPITLAFKNVSEASGVHWCPHRQLQTGAHERQ